MKSGNGRTVSCTVGDLVEHLGVLSFREMWFIVQSHECCWEVTAFDAFSTSNFPPLHLNLHDLGHRAFLIHAPHFFDQMPRLFFFFPLFILVRLLFEGSVYLVGKLVDSNDD